MWIMNQTGTICFNIDMTFAIVRDYVKIKAEGVPCVLGIYATPERATEVLNMIFSHIGSDKAVFRMPKE